MPMKAMVYKTLSVSFAVNADMAQAPASTSPKHVQMRANSDPALASDCGGRLLCLHYQAAVAASPGMLPRRRRLPRPAVSAVRSQPLAQPSICRRGHRTDEDRALHDMRSATAGSTASTRRASTNTARALSILRFSIRAKESMASLSASSPRPLLLVRRRPKRTNEASQCEAEKLSMYPSLGRGTWPPRGAAASKEHIYAFSVCLVFRPLLW